MANIGRDPFRAARLILSLRQVGVTDNRVLAAMEMVPRELFVSEEAAEMAYEDVVLPIDCGQTLLRPSVIGHLLQMAELSENTPKTLLIGSGSGYIAALLCHLSGKVFAVERYKRLQERAISVLGELKLANAEFLHGDGLDGWSANAPYDRIILTGIAPEDPVALMQQLDPSGRLIYPISTQAGQNISVRGASSKALNVHPISGFSPLISGKAQEL